MEQYIYLVKCNLSFKENIDKFVKLRLTTNTARKRMG